MTKYNLKEILGEVISGFKHYCFIIIILCFLGIIVSPGIIGCYIIFKWLINLF